MGIIFQRESTIDCIFEGQIYPTRGTGTESSDKVVDSWRIPIIHKTNISVQFRTILGQFFLTIGALRPAVDLIRDRQLWRGINRYGWVVKVLVVVAILIGFSFLGQVSKWIGSLFVAERME